MNQKNLGKMLDKKTVKVIKKQQEFFEPYSSSRKKNIKLLQIIFELKSKELKLFEKLIFDKNYQLSEFSDKELLFFVKKIHDFYGEFSKGIKNKSYVKRKNQVAYLELVTGIKSKTLMEYGKWDDGEEKRKEKIEKLYEKYGGFDKVPKDKLNKLTLDPNPVSHKKLAKYMEMSFMITQMIRKKMAEADEIKRPKKLTTKQKKQLVEMKEKIHKASDKGEKNSEKYSEKIKEVEEQIQKISKLTDSCDYCYQKVTKTYQKNKLRKLEKEKKLLSKKIEMLRLLTKNLQRVEFTLNKNKFLPFNEAREFTRMLMLKSEKEWYQYAIEQQKIPVNIPTYPNIEYKSNDNEEGWISWEDWLGTKPVKYRSFKEAREFVRKMNLKTGKDWRKAINSGMIPKDIPISPDKVYKKQWKGEKDYFGL